MADLFWFSPQGQELQRAYDGPIPSWMLPGLSAREELKVSIGMVRRQGCDLIRSARGWLLKGNREMWASDRADARLCLERYLELRAKLKALAPAKIAAE